MTEIRHLLFDKKEVRPQRLGSFQAQPDREAKITRIAARLMGEAENACLAKGQHYRNSNTPAWL